MPDELPARDNTGDAESWPALASGSRVVVLTGAGMSAESGIATFREPLAGLWATFRPEDLATRDGWRRDPAQVWAWYAERKSLIRQAQPHAGHQALVALESQFDVTVVTQNVDDLHEIAGSSRVLHLHGQIFDTRCFACDRPGPFEAIDAPAPMRCRRCGGWLRPDVVWFGEALPHLVWLQAEAAVAQADLVLVVGTSGTVQPAAGLAWPAVERGCRALEVNPSPWLGERSDGRVTSVAECAGTALPRLAAALLGHGGLS